jgi:hypothetical protein
MVLSIMVPHFPAIGSGGMPPVPPTILMSALWVGLAPTSPTEAMTRLYAIGLNFTVKYGS